MKTIPDPNDRTINEPCVLLSSKNVIAIYRKMKNIGNGPVYRDIVRDWFKEEAKKAGWTVVEFQGEGYQCLLNVCVNISTSAIVSTKHASVAQNQHNR